MRQRKQGYVMWTAIAGCAAVFQGAGQGSAAAQTVPVVEVRGQRFVAVASWESWLYHGVLDGAVPAPTPSRGLAHEAPTVRGGALSESSRSQAGSEAHSPHGEVSRQTKCGEPNF